MSEGAPGAGHGFGYKPALDGLRAVAVGSVIAFHFGWSASPGGFLGVDTFFVLSGYLITTLLLVEWGSTGRLSLSSFWTRRARRLLPALLLVLVAVFGWAYFSVDPTRLDAIRQDGLSSLFYGANWNFIDSGQSYFDLFNEASPLRHMWSLAIEEQFYLVWPLITLACLKIGRGRSNVLAGVCVTGIVGSAALMAMSFDSSDPSRAYFGTDTRASQLLIGALLAIVLTRWAPRTRASRAAVQVSGVVGAGLCVWAFAGAHDQDAWLYYGGMPLFAIATALVITAIVQPGVSPLQGVLSFRPLRWIGQISYGLYLWHWPVTVAVSERRTSLEGTDLALTRLALTFGLAMASYYLLELPIRRGVFRGWRSRLAAPAGIATVGVAMLVTTAGAIAPPDYFRSEPGKLVSTPSVAPAVTIPTDSFSQTASTVPGVPTPAEVGTVLLIGDSVAQSLAPGLLGSSTARGYSAAALTAPGCGGLGGRPVLPDGTEFEWGSMCEEAIPDFQRTAVPKHNARVVVFLDTWQVGDRMVNGSHMYFGTQEGDTVMLGLYDELWRNLTATGARLVLVTMPPDAESRPPDPAIQAKITRLNALMRRFARLHPESVSVADLAAVVCPGGAPCPESVEGVVLRSDDGRHYDKSAQNWVAPRLLDLVLASLAPGTTSAPLPR